MFRDSVGLRSNTSICKLFNCYVTPSYKNSYKVFVLIYDLCVQAVKKKISSDGMKLW